MKKINEKPQNLAIDAELIAKYRNDKASGMKPLRYIEFDFLLKKTLEVGSFINSKTDFYVWKLPEAERKYVVSCDVSRGGGSDYSTIQVIDIESKEQVAEYKGKISPDLFMYMIDWVGRKYNEALVVIEANSFGLGICFRMKNQMCYKNLFYSKNVKDMNVKNIVEGKAERFVAEGEQIPGFQTTRKQYILAVTSLRAAMRDNLVVIHSKRLLFEMDTFIVEDGKVMASEGNSDDLIKAMSIGLYVVSGIVNDVTEQKIAEDSFENLSSMYGFDVEKNSKKVINKTTKMVTYTIKNDTAERFDKYAEVHSTNRSAFVDKLIGEELDRLEIIEINAESFVKLNKSK